MHHRAPLHDRKIIYHQGHSSEVHIEAKSSIKDMLSQVAVLFVVQLNHV